MKISRTWGTVLLFGVLASRLASAQVTTGTITGVVKDTTGAIIPGASVKVQNTDTSASRTLVSDDSGRYQATQLSLGHYAVDVSLAGYQTATRKGIELTVGTTAVVDVTLNVGQLEQSLVVTGDAPLVDTTTSSVGGVIGQTAMAALPLNGRDFTQLTLLIPGVVDTTSIVNVTPLFGISRRIAVAGARASVGGTYLLDGTNIMGFWNDQTGSASLGTALGVDAIREFKVETNNFSAEYGRAGGSAINAVSKSGSNEFHGGVFEYLRNSALDARNFFDPARIPPFKRNQFGGTIGGPILRNKTFFFANYEGLRERKLVTRRSASPTALARQGTLPTGTVAVNSAILPLLNLLPAPNGRDLGGGVGELINQGSRPLDENYVTGRIDHRFSDNDSLFVRYVFDNGSLTEPYPSPSTIDPIFGELLQSRNQYLTIQENRIFSNAVVNALRLSFNRSNMSGQSPFRAPALDFLPGEHRANAASVSISGVGQIGQQGNTPFQLIINMGSLADDLNVVKGPHALKIGFEGQKIQNPYRLDIGGGGSMSFNNLRDFLTGTPFTFSIALPGKFNTQRTWQQSVFGMYVTDSYKVRSNLTLNMGLRYEFITNPTEKYGRFSSVLNVSDPVPVHFDHVFRKNPSLKNFAPRFGFAWDVSGTGKTSVRGGFGMFYSQFMPRNYGHYGFNPPDTIISLGVNPGFPPNIASLAATAGSFSLVTGYNITSTPYMLQYNLNIQHEIFANTLVSIGYVGSGGRKLLGAYDFNQPRPTTVSADGRPVRPAGTPRPNPNFANMQFDFPMFNSNYNSLTASVERRFAGGSYISANWNWSHSLDTDSSEFNGDGFNSAGEVRDINKIAADYGNSTFDIRHVATVNYDYQLPFGSGKPFGGGWTGLTQKLLGGWETTGISRFSSGPPFQVVNGFDRSHDLRTGANRADRVDLRPGFTNNPRIGDPTRWFDPNAFALQPDGTYGNLGRNTLRGPGLISVDLGLAKNIKVREQVNAQFRFEAFNIINRANFAVPPIQALTLFLDPSGTINPLAGRIASTTTTARQLQFALRLEF